MKNESNLIFFSFSPFRKNYIIYDVEGWFLKAIGIKRKYYKNFEYYKKNDGNISCYYSVLFDRITVSNGFFRKLGKHEANFLLYHEESHKKDRSTYLTIYISASINIALFLVFSLMSIFVYVDIEIALTVILLEIIYFSILIFIYRCLEYRADEYAVKNVHYRYFVSAVEKMKKETRSTLLKVYGKLTHPCVEKRIEHLKKVYEQQK